MREKLVCYSKNLKMSEIPTMEELIIKYREALLDLCFDDNAEPILDLTLLKQIVEEFNFYYMLIENDILNINIQYDELRRYMYDHLEEINKKVETEFTDADRIYIYMIQFTKKCELEKVTINYELFKQAFCVCKYIKESEWNKTKKHYYC